MSSDHSALASKVWSLAHVLPDQGIGYDGQITFLLYLKLEARC